MKLQNLKIAFLFLLVLAVTAAPASATTVSRTLPSSVQTGTEFQVAVNVNGYGGAGQIVEKIPAGFTFVKSNLDKNAVTVKENATGDEISFLLLNESTFSYTVNTSVPAGTYTFKGLLRDISKTQFPISDSTLKVTAKDDGTNTGGSSRRSGSGGGGGGVVSPEAASNIEARELSQQVVSVGHVRFDFPKGATCIKYVEFDSKKNAGKITTTVEMLKGKSSKVSGQPSGELYKYVNIWVGSGGFASPENLANGIVGFKVEKSWLAKTQASSVSLWLYNGKTWDELATEKIGEDDRYALFEAKTSGFSYFAITAPAKGTFEIQPKTEPGGAGKDKAPAAEAQKTPEKPSGIPGFEAFLTAGLISTTYYVFRNRK